MTTLSTNTQVILMLTAPLLAGSRVEAPLLKPHEYRGLARRLRELDRQPGDLMGAASDVCLRDCAAIVEPTRMTALLNRGMALSQALEHWQQRSIWVLSRADAHYPVYLKKRMRDEAPAVIYGCGDTRLLASGGLAVVGSRSVGEDLLAYTMHLGCLTARAGRAIVSGGAKGVDAASMRGALEAGGIAVGILPGELERTALNRDHRGALMDGQLVLVSVYDPKAKFSAGAAMGRNKLIYAMADAALVVEADAQKGGTREGVLEQLKKLHYVPVYVRTTGQPSPGLETLRQAGARDWPNPQDADALSALLQAASEEQPPTSEQSLFVKVAAGTDIAGTDGVVADMLDLLPETPAGAGQTTTAHPEATALDAMKAGDGERGAVVDQTTPPAAVTKLEPELITAPDAAGASPADRLLECVKNMAMELLAEPMRLEDFADALQVTKPQAKSWLDALEKAGQVVKLSKPVRYTRRERDLLG